MRLPRRLAAAAACLALLAEAQPAVAPVRADRELLARLARETGAATSPPGPSAQEYIATVARRVMEALLGWLTPPATSLESTFGLLLLLAQVLAWTLVIIVLVLLARLLVAAWKRRSGRASGMAGDAGVEVTARPRLGPEAWLRRFREALEGGDLDAALHALWMCAGLRLAGPELDGAWTSSELLAHAGRHDLRPVFARLDAWRYGPGRPRPALLERLADELVEATG